MKTELIAISKLKLLEKNPRRITKEQMDKLCRSIENDPNFLECRPVLVNCIYVDDKPYMHVYAGNQRVRAAKKLGMKEIPCIVEYDLDEATVKKRIIQDNKTYGEFDWDILGNEYDIELLLESGFKAEEILGDLSNISDDVRVDGNNEEDDKVLEPPKEPKTKPGDLYELGRHRLVCGDSTNDNDVSLCLDKNTPILMCTDPPYGVNYDPAWRKDIKGKLGVACRAVGKVQNDDKIDWVSAWELFKGQVCYVWHAGKYCSEVQKSLEMASFEIISQIIWKKQHFCLSRGDYHWHHEPCWYAVKKDRPHNWQGARDQSTIWEISNMNAFGAKKEESGEERTAHSTQKPIECMARPIRNNTAEGEGVYDPFLGSGTTLIACEKLNRICYGLEIDPGYCDIIVDRWCKLTGKKAKRNGVEIDQL